MSAASKVNNGLTQAYPLEMSWQAGTVFAAVLLSVLGTGFAIGMKYQEELVKADKVHMQSQLDDVNRRLQYVDPAKVLWQNRENQMSKLLDARNVELAYSVSHASSSKNCAFLQGSILSEQSMILVPDMRKPGHNMEQYQMAEKERIAILDKRIANFQGQFKHFRCK